MYPYRRLAVWTRSRSAAMNVYRTTQSFPATERYGLVTQMRRAAVSVCANIVEGSKRVTARDFARFLNVAEGSAAEVGFLLELSRDLGYITPETASGTMVQYDELERMLSALRQRVASR